RPCLDGAQRYVDGQGRFVAFGQADFGGREREPAIGFLCGRRDAAPFPRPLLWFIAHRTNLLPDTCNLIPRDTAPTGKEDLLPHSLSRATCRGRRHKTLLHAPLFECY